MLLRSLPKESRNRLARDVFDTFTTHAGHVYDVTDTDCWGQNGLTQCRAFTTFKRRLLTNGTRSRMKNCCWPVAARFVTTARFVTKVTKRAAMPARFATIR